MSSPVAFTVLVSPPLERVRALELWELVELDLEVEPTCWFLRFCAEGALVALSVLHTGKSCKFHEIWEIPQSRLVVPSGRVLDQK